MMMRKLSKLAGVLLALSLVLGLPFVAAAAGQFTVELNADGTVSRVFQGSITSRGQEIKRDPRGVGGLGPHLQGKSVNNIRSVTIVTTPGDPCISSGGDLWCW